MTQTKIYCDHCGKELDEVCDYPDIELEIIDDILECDLCRSCYEELSRDVRKFVSKEAK